MEKISFQLVSSINVHFLVSLKKNVKSEENNELFYQRGNIEKFQLIIHQRTAKTLLNFKIIKIGVFNSIKELFK